MPDADNQISGASTTGGLPVDASLAPVLQAARTPTQVPLVSLRTIYISALSILIACAAGLVAHVLTALIGLITNLSFYGRFSFAFNSPAGNHLGAYVILIPVIGELIVGLMARFGSEAIRGHGIPEPMEQVLLGSSRIPPRIAFLKPLSAAIDIGTGGPFGAEGPIIATGAALGSLVGQLLKITADERKTLLAAGAAAGMAATFGSPRLRGLARHRTTSLRIPSALHHSGRPRVRYGSDSENRLRGHRSNFCDAGCHSTARLRLGGVRPGGGCCRYCCGARNSRRLWCRRLI